MEIKTLILWTIQTPHHGELKVNAKNEKQALEKAIEFIHETPLDKRMPTKVEDLVVCTAVDVIDAVIL